MPGPTLRIRVRDAFRVTDGDGRDLTPRSAKACGILALLAFAPDHRRPRGWIAAHLWSADRGGKSGRVSARQAFGTMRRDLGEAGAVLLGEGTQWMGLACDAVEIDDAGEGRLLDGLVIRDPAFERWLEDLRARDAAARPITTAGTPAPAEPPDLSGERIHVVCRGGGGGARGEHVGALIAHQIGEGIEARVGVRRLVDAGPSRAIDVEVRCGVIEGDGVSIALVEIVHPASGVILYKREHRLDGPAALLATSEATARMTAEAAEIAVEELPHFLGVDRPVLRASALAQVGISKLFSFDASAMAEADGWLASASSESGDGLYDAWRGFGQMLRHVDLGLPLTPDLHERIDEHAARADAHDRRNPAVGGLTSFIRLMLRGDADGIMERVVRTAEVTPTSPFALISLSAAHLRAGDPERAYQASHRARHHAANLRHHQWWDVAHCAACLATRRIDEALEAATSALRPGRDGRAPQHRAAMRYLIALHAERGDLARACEVSAGLARIEPGFSLDRMLRDPDYPARTLRQTGLLRSVARLL